MKTFRHHFFFACAVVLLAGCGGGDPGEVADATPHASAVRHEAGSPRADASASKPTVLPDAQPGVVLAGAATTQDAIDRALALNAATAATQR